MRALSWRTGTHFIGIILLVFLISGCGSGSKPGPGPVSLDNVTVYAFSQVGSYEEDPQVLELKPDINIRAWQRWDIYGTKPGDYNFSYTSTCRNAGVIFVAGTTASAYFRDEAADDAEYQSMVSRDAGGRIVLHDTPGSPGLRRATLANPAYRDYLVRIAKIQIDGGVQGLFFDEVNGGYAGQYGDGNEGFDDFHLADFNAYLIAKYPGYTAADWQTRFGMESDNIIHPDLSPKDLTHNFNYRRYLATKGWASNPHSPANPLASEWGQTAGNRPNPNDGCFLEQYVSKVYWKDIVDRVRAYAASKGKSVLITSNGIFPYVDFQGFGLYDYNADGVGGSMVDYCPVSGGHLNGSVSLLEDFRRIKARSTSMAGDVPVVLFIDWPSSNMDRYNNLPLQERQDYWRMYAAEAYAAGVYFAFHLHTCTGEPTATQAGVMPLFKQLAAFYRSHGDLFHGVSDTGTSVTVNAPNVTYSLWAKNGQNKLILHLINHHYNAGFQSAGNFTVVLPMAKAPSSVKLISPDLDREEDVPFTFAVGNLTLSVRSLTAYDILVIND